MGAEQDQPAGGGSAAGAEGLVDGPYGMYDPRPGAYGENDPGGGPYLEDLGIREWYLSPNSPQSAPGKQSVHWRDILANWDSVETDLHDVFGIDCESGILVDRTWRWLNLRILDLINRPSQLRRALNLMSETTK